MRQKETVYLLTALFPWMSIVRWIGRVRYSNIFLKKTDTEHIDHTQMHPFDASNTIQWARET